MKLTTHNTMTYLKPKQWWCKLLPFIARCQSVDYKKQHELGAEGFDIRLFFSDKDELQIRHGSYIYPTDELDDVLKYAEDNNIIVRILFEERSYMTYKNIEHKKELFVNKCTEIEQKYPSLKLYGGVSTGTWERLYTFKNIPDMVEESYYSSVTSLFESDNKTLRVIDDWCPWLYAKLRNKKNIKALSDRDDNCYLAIDFINIQ